MSTESASKRGSRASPEWRIARVRLQNWMNFSKVDAALRDRLFLVGPNASGKSNFLDAIRFLRDLASSGGGLQEAVKRRGGVSAIRCLAARRHSDVSLLVEVPSQNGDDSWTYAIDFNQDSQRRPVVKAETVTRGGVKILDRPNEEDRSDPARLTQTYLEQVNVNRPFRDLVGCFASIRYLHIVPQLIRDPDRSVGRSNDPFGGDFLAQVAKAPEMTRRARLRKIQEALRVAVPQLEAVELWRDDSGTLHLRGKYQHWRPQGAWQTEEQFSDGTLRLLGLLWVVMEGGGPLLLEEPELSIHPEIVRQLPALFARVRRRTGRQIIVSTHSPDLLRDEGIGLDEVLLLRPGGEGTEIRAACEFQEIVTLLEGGLTLDEVVIPKTRPEEGEQLSLFGDL